MSFRTRILKHKGVAGFEKLTRAPLTPDQIPAKFDKTPLMKLVELRHMEKIEKLVWKYPTLDEVAKYLDIERSTVSKWRKLIRESK